MSTAALLLQDLQSIFPIVYLQLSTVFQRYEEQPTDQEKVTDDENAQSDEKNALVQSCDPESWHSTEISRVKECDSPDDGMPNTMNDQIEYTHNGIFIHRRQVRDGWLNERFVRSIVSLTLTSILSPEID